MVQLLSDVSGDKWVMHMLYGCGRLLQLTKDSEADDSKEAFLEVFRVMELNRAIMYGNGTFLSQPEWTSRCRQAGEQTAWESITEMTNKVSSFNER